ncbi:Protein of unknown function [Gryllus bimaculatus]|nr:Protein of unknown function [Gryllus bimaculatus]
MDDEGRVWSVCDVSPERKPRYVNFFTNSWRLKDPWGTPDPPTDARGGRNFFRSERRFAGSEASPLLSVKTGGRGHVGIRVWSVVQWSVVQKEANAIPCNETVKVMVEMGGSGGRVEGAEDGGEYVCDSAAGEAEITMAEEVEASGMSSSGGDGSGDGG